MSLIINVLPYNFLLFRVYEAAGKPGQPLASDYPYARQFDEG